MTTQLRLTPDGPPDEGQRQKYRPVVADVTGFSQYNPEQFSLSGVDGFWSLAPRLAEKMGTPTKGTRALWTLTTRPKTGPKAKPGSVYMDVIAVAKVPQGYAENDVEDLPWDADAERDAPAPERAPAQQGFDVRQVTAPRSSAKPHPDAIRESDPLPAEWTLPLSYYKARGKEIAAMNVLNNVTLTLNSPHVHTTFNPAQVEQMKAIYFGLIDRLAPELPIALGNEPVESDIDGEPDTSA